MSVANAALAHLRLLRIPSVSNALASLKEARPQSPSRWSPGQKKRFGASLTRSHEMPVESMSIGPKGCREGMRTRLAPRETPLKGLLVTLEGTITRELEEEPPREGDLVDLANQKFSHSSFEMNERAS
jgi:hypothetical protein